THVHGDVLWAERLLYFLQRPSPLHQPGRERVPEVVEPEALDTGRSQGRLPGAAKRIPVPAPEDVAFGPGRPAPSQDGVGVCAEWHLPAPAALVQLATDDALCSVHA